ncbi:hypothetical protein MiSe_70080 [Microseira wollei NIES-4236]|uniref:Uncharacterized protein n=1 Tax=Microseira wollei NIES-4236 TaxID=2530354 RepID=A0AAV3XNH1_9CYAN|nr:hypothetical protein MiSe_70080 [Microseira wollei NIES-4236]
MIISSKIHTTNPAFTQMVIIKTYKLYMAYRVRLSDLFFPEAIAEAGVFHHVRESH